jgi:hypothetical protein
MDGLTVQEWESLSTEVKSLSSPSSRVDTVVFVDDPSNRPGHSGRPEERFTPKSLRNFPALWRGGSARSLHRSALRRFQR